MNVTKDISSYKRYKIQTIINPATFYVVDYEKEGKNDRKQRIQPRDVRKFKNSEEICIGQVVAVKYQNEFHKGLINDIYNRRLKPTFYVLLIDLGVNIETSADSVFMIRVPELRNKKSDTVKIIVHGIKPVTIEILVNSVYLDHNVIKDDFEGILHKRESKTWSQAAFKFIEDLFIIDKCIYVKCIDINGATIIGDVYYRRKDDGALTSLAQSLCDKDFALFYKSQSEITKNNEGEKYLCSIERRIPNVPDVVEWDELSVIDPTRMGNESSWGNSSIYTGSDKSCYSDSENLFKNSADKASPSGTNSLSPSWILKKMTQLSESTSSESFKSGCHHIEHTKNTGASPKVSLFRIVQRNVELHDKQNSPVGY